MISTKLQELLQMAGLSESPYVLMEMIGKPCIITGDEKEGSLPLIVGTFSGIILRPPFPNRPPELRISIKVLQCQVIFIFDYQRGMWEFPADIFNLININGHWQSHYGDFSILTD